MKVLRSVALIAAIVLVWAPLLRAQDAVSLVPEPVYAPSDISPPEEVAAPMPNSDPSGDGSVVTVPIPGGGSVIVEGPDLQSQSFHSPIETWGGIQVAPNSISGISPLGPGPH